MAKSKKIDVAAEAADRAGFAPRGSDASATPRVVTTGGTQWDAHPDLSYAGKDPETGESLYSFWANGTRQKRFLDTSEEVPSNAAFIDALAFSIVPPAEQSFDWVLKQMTRFLPIESVEARGGLFGFKFSARFGDGAGIVAWGGDSQRGKVYFSLMGKGCSMVQDWAGLSAWLAHHSAVIKRADVAYDDFEGKQINIAWAVDQYRGGGFNAGGRRPRSECFGDWLDGEACKKGRTLGIGNRANGKYARCYEKGKQLGDPSSRWTRVEVEWRAEDRFIPIDILTRPGHYLAGAYPCLAFISQVQSTIKTISKGAQIAFDCAVENAKQHCGKLVNLMLSVVGGDYAEVVNQLIRPGIPARIDPFSYHVSRNPAMLDRELREAFA